MTEPTQTPDENTVAAEAATEAPEATEATTEATPEIATESVPTEAATTEEAAPETPTGPTDEELAATYQIFTDAVKAAYDARDMTNASVPSDKVEAVQAAYKLLNTKQRKEAKADLAEGLRVHLTETADIISARFYMDMQATVEKAKAVTRETVAAPVVDPTQAFVNTSLGFYLASQLLVPPADIAPNWGDMMAAQAQEINGEPVEAVRTYMAAKAAWDAETEHAEGATEPVLDPNTPASLVLALALVSGKRTAGRKATGTTGTRAPRAPRAPSVGGTRGNIGAHIAKFFADKPVGTAVKFGDIAAFTSSEYPGANASGGAIGAFFDRGNFASTPGIAPTLVDGKKGAIKNA